MAEHGIRVIATEGGNLDTDTANHLANLFNQISSDPSKAKQVGNSYALDFPDFDTDSRPMYAIPEIRSFVQTIDNKCPHFAYFLYRDPAVSQVDFYLLCLVSLLEKNNNYQYALQDLIAIALNRFEQVANFAQRIGDDTEQVFNSLLMALPPQVLRGDPALALQALTAMQPTLEILKHDFPNLIYRPDGRAIIQDVLNRAATLAGIENPDTLDIKLLNDILSRLH